MNDYVIDGILLGQADGLVTNAVGTALTNSRIGFEFVV